MGFDLKELAAQHGIKTTDEIAALNEKSYKHIEVEGNLYRVKMLGGRKGVSIALRLKSIALPLIGQGFDGVKAENNFVELPRTFTQMAMILNEQMDNVGMESLIFDSILFDVSIKDGDNWKAIDWDEHLMGNYGCLIPLLTFALKENFSSFFTGSGMMKGILSKVQNLWDSNQEYTQDDTETE